MVRFRCAGSVGRRILAHLMLGPPILRVLVLVMRKGMDVEEGLGCDTGAENKGVIEVLRGL